MKKDKKILLGVLVLGVWLLTRKDQAPAPQPKPAVQPAPVPPKSVADLPNSVSGRYPLGNYKIA